MTHRPRKRFGQHFLHDPAVVARLLEAIGPQPNQAMVEIGPGEGVMTRPLLEAASELDVVELDRDLAAALESDSLPGLRVHSADALEFDFLALAAERGKPLRVVGNLPYNISTPILFHLLGQADAVADMHFMLQREVVDRITAGPGGADYGRLSVMVQYRCRTRRLFRVGPGAFRPAPKVDSALVRLEPFQQPPVDVGDERVFERVVKAAFGQRRKILRNALSALLDAAAIEAAGVDPGARAQTLSLDAFAALARAANLSRRRESDVMKP